MPIYGKFCGGFPILFGLVNAMTLVSLHPGNLHFFSTAEGLEDEFSAKKTFRMQKG